MLKVNVILIKINIANNLRILVWVKLIRQFYCDNVLSGSVVPTVCLTSRLNLHSGLYGVISAETGY